MNRYMLDRLMNADGENRRSNGQFARDRRQGGRGRDSRNSGNYGGGERSYGRDRTYSDYDSHYDFEYNSGSMELPERDLRKWQRELGEKFTTEQAEKLARQIGVNFEHFTPQEFTVVMNMLYSDFGEALRKAGVSERPELYAYLAKAWLCDEDFDGEPYEKLALYYYAIVDYDE